MEAGTHDGHTLPHGRPLLILSKGGVESVVVGHQPVCIIQVVDDGLGECVPYVVTLYHLRKVVAVVEVPL